MGKLKKSFPEEKEIVLCTVKKILRDSIFVSLDEYENKEGMIHISEIAPGRIRNIRDYVKEDKKIVCLVLRMNQEKGHIDLSLRRVSLSMKINKNEEVKQEKKAEKILEAVGKKLKKTLNQMYDEAGNKIIEEYGLIYPCFQDIVVAGEEVLLKLGIDKKIVTEIIKIVKERIKPPEVKVDYILSLNSKAHNGIELIKKTLKKAEDLAKTKAVNLKITYLGAPRYKLTIKGQDYKIVEKQIEEIGELAIKDIKTQGGSGELKREEK
ncbi:MAG: translation initiation factor IF-2 subunit alpha [Candidatus Nanoarchaeia archaeon]|nr:translation initiation factor IF-2 subunit alpha [Candidatus Nanoarchaeia archaeon]